MATIATNARFATGWQIDNGGPMFGIVAIVLFTVAAVLSGTGTHVSSNWFQPSTLGYLGLACLAVHLVIDAVRQWPTRR